MNQALNSGNSVGGIKLVTVEAAINTLYGQIESEEVSMINLNTYEGALLQEIDQLHKKCGYSIDTRRSTIEFDIRGSTVYMACDIAFDKQERYPDFIIQIPASRLCKR